MGASEATPTFLALMVLEEFHSLKSSSSAEQLVGELGLIWVICAAVVVATVDLLVGVLRVICVERERGEELLAVCDSYEVGWGQLLDVHGKKMEERRGEKRRATATYPSRTCLR